ncbi:MAG: chemotaxis protein CheW [Candidatus Eisenbacteria bacterium]
MLLSQRSMGDCLETSVPGSSDASPACTAETAPGAVTPDAATQDRTAPAVAAPPFDHTTAKRAKVVWSHRGTLICVGIGTICGCAGFTRPGRVPGSQESVKGLIDFEGKIIPLVSLPGNWKSGARQKAGVEDFAIVLSIDGIKFALRVEEVPRAIYGADTLPDLFDAHCCFRTSHLRRLLRLCVTQKSDNAEQNGARGAKPLSR